MQLKNSISGSIITTLLIALLLPFAHGSVQAQEKQPAIEFIKQFKNIQDQLPRESVYLHTDRDWYYFGERIWFSAYSVAGGYTMPSELSSVLYVELIAPNGDVAKRELIKMEEGRGEGSLTFEDVEKDIGTYQVKAYTKWGLNFGDSYAFTKPIQILNENGNTQVATSGEKFDLQFFPESGHLVSGLPTTLAFKAIGEDGLGRNIQGTIYDNSGQEITNFTSDHLGMGKIDFTPKAGTEYYAKVDNKEVPLPEVQSEGVVLNIDHKEDFFTVNLQASDNLASDSYFLFAHVRGNVFHAAPISKAEKGVSAMIPKNQFASGIVHFTLLNENGAPIAERLAYAQNPVDLLQVNADLDQEVYEAREQVELNLALNNHKGEPVKGTASISVFDDNIRKFDQNGIDITSHLRLGTEIKGHIEDPGFYFSDDPNAESYLDLLLLTQGWRAYPMQIDAMKEQLESLTPPETGISVSGKVSTLWFDKPIEDAVVYAETGSGNDNAQIMTTDKEGRYELDNLDITGEQNVTLKSNKDNGSDKVWITIDEQFEDFPNKYAATPQLEIAQQVLKPQTADQEISTADRASSAINKAQQSNDFEWSEDLGEITVTGESEYNLNLQQYLNDFQGRGIHVDMAEREYLRNLPVEQVFNLIPGVNFNPVENSIDLNNTTADSELNAPRFFVDGIPTYFEFVKMMNSKDIKSIIVTNGSDGVTYLGSIPTSGAIIITTHTGNGVQKNVRGLKNTYVQGYQEGAEFYHPKYNVTVPKDLEERDDRITLFWNPNIDLSSEGEIIEFWTNDISSNYRIVIEGISEDGNTFTHTQTFRSGSDISLNSEN
jgi:hypothetical protein